MQTDERRAYNQAVYRYILDPRSSDGSIGQFHLVFNVGVNMAMVSSNYTAYQKASLGIQHLPALGQSWRRPSKE